MHASRGKNPYAASWGGRWARTILVTLRWRRAPKQGEGRKAPVARLLHEAGRR